MDGWGKSYLKSSELELNVQRKTPKFAQSSPSLNVLIFVVFKLFPHFPKKVSTNIFQFSVFLFGKKKFLHRNKTFSIISKASMCIVQCICTWQCLLLALEELLRWLWLCRTGTLGKVTP